MECSSTTHTPEKLQVVSSIWNRAFENTDILYIAKSNITRSSKYECTCTITSDFVYCVYIYSVLLIALPTGAASLTLCVQIGVIGYFSADGKVKHDHFNFEKTIRDRILLPLIKKIMRTTILLRTFHPLTMLFLTQPKAKVYMSFHVIMISVCHQV